MDRTERTFVTVHHNDGLDEPYFFWCDCGWGGEGSGDYDEAKAHAISHWAKGDAVFFEADWDFALDAGDIRE